MHNHPLSARPALSNDLLSGLNLSQGTTQIRLMQPGSIVSVATSENQIHALNDRLNSLFGLSFPSPGRVHRTNSGLSLLGLQKQQCFLVAEADEPAADQNTSDQQAASSATQQSDNYSAQASTGAYQQHVNRLLDLSRQLVGKAYITDQSDAWVALLLEGPDARRVLERLCSLDMQADKFTQQHVARTIIDHLTVIIERTDDDLYRLYTPRSSAHDLVSAFATALTSVCNRV